MTIHSSGQTIFDFILVEGITLSACEEVDEFARGASGMCMERIDQISDRSCEGLGCWPVWVRLYSGVSGKCRNKL